MRAVALVMACLARASYGRRVQSISQQESSHSQPVALEALSALLQASTPDAGWQVASGTGLSRNPAMQKPKSLSRVPRTAAVSMEEATLEDQLKDGLITQEEYDMLSSAVEEDDYLTELANEDPEAELSQEAKEEKARLSSSTGVEFAPWMKVDPEAIARAKKERAERQARLAAENANKRVDAAYVDPQAAEVGAIGGLKEKIISPEEVELTWFMEEEGKDVRGYIVQRRKGRTEDWVTLKSWEKEQSLRARGGGNYVYLDDAAQAGNWVYRIIDETDQGRSVVTQKLVEIETQEEQLTSYFAAGGLFALFAVGWAVTSGIDYDSLK